MTIAVGKVEKELSSLRASTARASDPDGLFPDIRASVASLVIWAAGAPDCSTAMMAAGDVAARHPCRTIGIVPADGTVSADVSVQCTLAPAAEHQVCFEQIVLRGGTPGQAASAAEQLLLPDVPVVLWCVPDVLTADAERLLDAADRFIVDSHYADDPFVVARGLAATAGDRPHLWVADLDWGRLTPWRKLFAQFFDAAALRPLLREVRSVRIRHVERGLRPYLLAGWVVDRLNLDPGRVEIHVDEVPRSEGRGLGAGHLLSLEMQTTGGSFTVERADDIRRLVARSTVEGGPPERSLRVPGPDLARVLTEELAQVGRDGAFIGALRSGLELAPHDNAPPPGDH